MSAPINLNHIIIYGGTNTSRYNMATYIQSSQPISYRIQLVVGTFPTINNETNYIFLTDSLSLIPANVRQQSVILSKPLVCI